MERRGQCIAVVSGKGGTGKTSLAAGVGAALALSGSRVLCLDCDVGLRNLDLTLGLSDRTLMDFSDVARGRCSLDMAAVEHPKVPGLFLLTAPVRMRGSPVTAEPAARAVGVDPQRLVSLPRFAIALRTVGGPPDMATLPAMILHVPHFDGGEGVEARARPDARP